MYLKKTRQKSGRIFLSIVDGYYDKKKGHSRTITIEKVGYLDGLEKQYEDPIAFFNERVQVLKREKAERKSPVSIAFSHDETLTYDDDYRKNVGYAVLSQIYHELEIDKFFINKQRRSKIGFSSNDIMKLLVFFRLLHPASKKKPSITERYTSKSTITRWMMFTVVCLSFINMVQLYRSDSTIETIELKSYTGGVLIWSTMT